MKLLELLILALATWRLSSLFANELGPFYIFKRIRSFICAKCPGIYEGLTCEWCNSIWFGTLLTILYFVFKTTVIWILLPLAFSAVTITIKHIVQSMQIYMDKNNKESFGE